MNRNTFDLVMKHGKRIYLDVCCLNRPFDDQSQDRIRMETEALLTILGQVQRGEWELVSSEALDLEIEQNPDIDRLFKVRDILGLASYYIHVGNWESDRARALARRGFGGYDAAHLACAESGQVTVLLTTDDGFIKQARRPGVTKVQVCNPLRWVAENDL
jgi:hypothetical protein